MTPAERIEALLQHQDPEVRWLAGYARRLTEAAGKVANHLLRISNPGFWPRRELENALEDGKWW
jgi:hypothetical protein